MHQSIGLVMSVIIRWHANCFNSFGVIVPCSDLSYSAAKITVLPVILTHVITLAPPDLP